MELLQTTYQFIWELLLQVQMPWRFFVSLFAILFVIPWFLLRGLPWILAMISKLILSFTNYLAIILLLPESFLSQQIRKQNREPPIIVYIFGRFLSAIIHIFYLINQTFESLFKYALTKRWLLKKGLFVTLSVIFSIIWVLQTDILSEWLSRKAMIYTTDGYANLRSSPSAKGKVIKQIKNGVQVIIIAEKTNSGGHIWYQVKVDGQTGWIYSKTVR